VAARIPEARRGEAAENLAERNSKETVPPWCRPCADQQAGAAWEASGRKERWEAAVFAGVVAEAARRERPVAPEGATAVEAAARRAARLVAREAVRLAEGAPRPEMAGALGAEILAADLRFRAGAILLPLRRLPPFLPVLPLLPRLNHRRIQNSENAPPAPKRSPGPSWL